MTALAAARLTESKNLGVVQRYLMAASTTIYAGSIVSINASGLAVPGANTSGHKGAVGVATETVTSAASGSYYVHVQEGTFKFAASSIAQSNVGDVLMIIDDQTVDETGSNNVEAGVLVQFVSSTEGWVKMGAGVRKA